MHKQQKLHTPVNQSVHKVGDHRNPHIQDRVGYPGLLNLQQPDHHTIVISDFELGARIRNRFYQALKSIPTASYFVKLDLDSKNLPEMPEITATSYVSFILLAHRHASYSKTLLLKRKYPTSDLARLELPSSPELYPGYSEDALLSLLHIIETADYHYQECCSELFFSLLGQNNPYTIDIETRGQNLLTISDDRPWFQLAGRLTSNEIRILPGGEVAYVGEEISGRFVADGALLAVPQDASGTQLARVLSLTSRSLKISPVVIDIEAGRIVDAEGTGSAQEILCEKLTSHPYNRVTEVGISFNTACDFIHHWPAASNEGRPGVHIGVGGDPHPDSLDERQSGLVHVDLMAASTAVTVNNALFIETE